MHYKKKQTLAVFWTALELRNKLRCTYGKWKRFEGSELGRN